MGLTTDRDNDCLNESKDNGQQECYLVLSEEEKAKGFIRPVRESYVHVGEQMDTSTMRDLTEDEHERYDKYDYIGFIPNTEEDSAITGTFITQERVDRNNGCGATTTMGLSIAETYARDPNFYGSTFCMGCGTHLPVREFNWYGTNETLGS
tara:strand:+ start:177007 stop:177459 length:453 start_codon:yes stop_codon:yes gene_type:complete